VSITKAQGAALVALASVVEEGTYLAGGVAVALTLAHRTSIDLDFFVPHEFDAEQLAERILTTLPPETHPRETGRARGTLHLEVEGVPVSILSYRYPLLAEPERSEAFHVGVASLDDLLCMKLAAIAGRGAAKDFWDLDALLGHGVAGGSLGRALDLFARKYPQIDAGHVVRSLAYFGEADAAPLPRGLDAAAWAALKDRVRARVTAL
jgi:hypothetical protein